VDPVDIQHLLYLLSGDCGHSRHTAPTWFAVSWLWTPSIYGIYLRGFSWLWTQSTCGTYLICCQFTVDPVDIQHLLYLLSGDCGHSRHTSHTWFAVSWLWTQSTYGTYLRGFSWLWTQSTCGTYLRGVSWMWNQSTYGSYLRGFNWMWTQSTHGNYLRGFSSLWTQSTHGTYLRGFSWLWTQSTQGTYLRGFSWLWTQSTEGTYLRGFNWLWSQSTQGTYLRGLNWLWSRHTVDNCVSSVELSQWPILAAEQLQCRTEIQIYDINCTGKFVADEQIVHRGTCECVGIAVCTDCTLRDVWVYGECNVCWLYKEGHVSV